MVRFLDTRSTSGKVGASATFGPQAIKHLGPKYAVSYGEPLPDTKETWRHMLREYNDREYQGRHSLTRARAGLRVAQGTKCLNGSLRKHNSFMTLTIQTPEHGLLVECSMSFEQLADLLVSQSDVPITVEYCTGKNGMNYSYPVPPPISVSRRLRERVSVQSDVLLRRLDEVCDLVRDSKAKLGVRKTEALLDMIGTIHRDVRAHGEFSAEQAQEELSGVAESMMTIMAERASMAGDNLASGFLADGMVPTTGLLLEGTIVEDD